MLASSHQLPQMVSNTDIMPPIPSMGIIPPGPSMTQRYFGTSTHNVVPEIGGEAAPKHETFGVLTGISSYPKPPGSNGSQMPIPPQMLGTYSNSPSGSLSLPSVPGTLPVNYSTSGAGMAGTSIHGEIMGPSGAGLYQQKPRLDPNLMPSVVCS